MSIFIGKVGTTPILHITNATTSAVDIATLSPIASTAFHSQMELLGVMSYESLTYVGTTNANAQELQASYDMEAVFSTTEFVMFLADFGTGYELITDYIFLLEGNTLFIASPAPTPVDVVAIHAMRVVPPSSGSVKISPTEFLVGGVNFATSFIGIAPESISSSDLSYATESGYVTLCNTSATNTGWFITSTSIGRTDSSNNFNYFVKDSLSIYNRYSYIGTAENVLTGVNLSLPSIFVYIYLPYVIDGTSDSDSTAVAKDWTSLYSVTTAKQNTDIYASINVHIASLPINAIMRTFMFRWENNSIQVYYADDFVSVPPSSRTWIIYDNTAPYYSTFGPVTVTVTSLV